MKFHSLRQLSLLILLILCFFHLQSCANAVQTSDFPDTAPPDALYRVEQEEGQLYIVIESENITENTEATTESNHNRNDCVAVPSTVTPLPFSTLADLRDKIMNYSVNAEELAMIATFNRDSNGRIRIQDLFRTCDPLLPEGMTYTHGEFYGTKFLLFLEGENGVSGRYTNCTVEDYMEEGGYESLLSQENMTVYQTDDRNATVIENQGLFSEIRRYLYTLTTDTATITVGELYELDSSSTTPAEVYIFMETDYQCYYVTLSGFTSRPSVEWLTAFGVAHIE